jgi:hypothetical protein
MNFLAVTFWDDDDSGEAELIEALSLNEAQKKWWLNFCVEANIPGIEDLAVLSDACPDRVLFLNMPSSPNVLNVAELIAPYKEAIMDKEDSEEEELREWRRVKARYNILSKKYADLY